MCFQCDFNGVESEEKKLYKRVTKRHRLETGRMGLLYTVRVPFTAVHPSGTMSPPAASSSSLVVVVVVVVVVVGAAVVVVSPRQT